MRKETKDELKCKTFISLLLIVIFVMACFAMSYGDAEAADTNQTLSAGSGSLTVTLDDLAAMSSTKREDFMSAYKAVQKAKEENAPLVDNAKGAVEKGLTILDGVDVENLSDKAVKIADAIVAFCTRLGIGVENVMTSKAFVLFMLIMAFKMGIFGAIGGTICCGIGVLIFSVIFIGANTNKKVKLTRVTKDESGKILSVTTHQEVVPRFNAIFDRFADGDDKFEKRAMEYYSAVSYYRVWASIISGAFVLLFLIFMCS